MLKKALLILMPFAGPMLGFGDEPRPGKGAPSANSSPIALEYKLTGIAKYRGTNQVYLVRHQADGTDLRLQLNQGERFDDLQVLDVNFKSRTVRVRYRGSEGHMNFNSHGIKVITTVQELGEEFVRVNKKFTEEHKRAHEERYRRRPAASQTAESAPPNSQGSSASP